jgi:hypothetical protein
MDFLRKIIEFIVIIYTAVTSFLGLGDNPAWSWKDINPKKVIVEQIDKAQTEINKEVKLQQTETKEEKINSSTTTNSVNKVLPKAIEKVDQNIKESVKNIVDSPKPVLPEITQPLTELILPEKENKGLENSLVHIICSTQDGLQTKVVTGSGVIVDKQGVILTNAHVALNVLLEDHIKDSKCEAYQKNIPTYGYKLDVLYFPSKWADENKNILKSSSPKGTGEYDFAFLVITDTTSPGHKKPSSFSSADLNLNSSTLKEKNKIFVAGYPGLPPTIFDINKAGRLKTDSTEITKVYSLSKNTIDILSSGVTSVAERGSSGGGVFAQGKLVGIIFSINEKSLGFILNSITLDYINRALIKDTNKSILELIQSSSLEDAKNFEKNQGSDISKIFTANR